MPHTPSLSRNPMAADASDLELAWRAASGDEMTFEAIMRRHNRLLFRTARAILKSDTDAEDVVQQAYLQAWQALGDFRADAKLSTWLVRIVVNEALGQLRRRQLKVVPLEAVMVSTAQMDASWQQDDMDRSPDRAAMRSELRRIMEARIDLLPDDFRRVFMLRGRGRDERGGGLANTVNPRSHGAHAILPCPKHASGRTIPGSGHGSQRCIHLRRGAVQSHRVFSAGKTIPTLGTHA